MLNTVIISAFYPLLLKIENDKNNIRGLYEEGSPATSKKHSSNSPILVVIEIWVSLLDG